MLAVINLVLLLLYFHDERVDKNLLLALKEEAAAAAGRGPINEPPTALSAAEAAPAAPPKPYRDNIAVAATMFCYFVASVTLAVFETVSTPLSMDEFGWDAQQGVVYNGIIGGLGGLISVGGFLLSRPLAARYGMRKLLIGSALFMVFGAVLFIPFTGPPPDLWCASRSGCLLSGVLPHPLFSPLVVWPMTAGV
jgi:hypothetical protein